MTDEMHRLASTPHRRHLTDVERWFVVVRVPLTSREFAVTKRLPLARTSA